MDKKKNIKDLAEKVFLIDYHKLFDEIPLILFIVDKDVRIIDMNQEAKNYFSLNIYNIYKTRSGEALHCLHSIDNPDECGTVPYCKYCIIRNSIAESYKGNQVHKKMHKMQLIENGEVKELYLRISTTPFAFDNNDFALLIIEDVTEIVRLKKLMPICSRCKKIRDDQNYWHSIESYLNKNIGAEFTHGLCDNCLNEMSKELDE